eukprot:TRINITY_DN12677_c0_g1_i2.p1 TRINITY_DN12677_c0_g1~~TRINITY_DN12677_c0_g1_i2.p1  ORF type:complete len:155 (-),score=28.13 TRINITY_DN12677_c0_g1_i2:61-525(-)
MGAHQYRLSPAKEKEIECGESKCRKLRFAAAMMPGWLNKMSLAFIAKTDLIEGVHLFAVFSGYLGQEVARFTQRHFEDELLKNDKFKVKDYEGALQDTFLHLDKLINTPKGRDELFSLSSTELEKEMYKSSDKGCALNVILITGDTIYLSLIHI